MSDPSCSGTTPFKRLVDQQGRDATLQQDRMVGRPGAQGLGSFRSVSQPVHAPAQQGFDQFVGGPAHLPGMPGMPMQHNHAAGRVASHTAALAGPNFSAHPPQNFNPQAPMFQPGQRPAAADTEWITQFEQFSQQPRQVQPPQNPQFSQGYHGTNQANMARNPAYMNNHLAMNYGVGNQMNYPHGPQMSASSAFQHQQSLPNGGAGPIYGPTNGGFMNPQQAINQRAAAEAEFDREMDEWMGIHGPAAESRATKVMETMADKIDADQRAAAVDANFTTAPATRQTAPLIPPELASLSSLSLEIDENKENWDPEEKDKVMADVTDPKGKKKSDVAEAASDLLKSVKHEQGEKWKKSRFLELMSDFADGKKDIVDNEIRDLNDADNKGPSTPTRD
ncbi:hypothetical protein B0T10DRAFT_555112 [Thelonectria olida]|uniref:Peroxin 20 n=1 Tax=Thelonectria olida TaxID=1576542 RepID=A0A9P8WH32_9HYPO|nr:hypothetical protein B0T10DRAFT_555112 [Thelonectria olida]